MNNLCEKKKFQPCDTCKDAGVAVEAEFHGTTSPFGSTGYLDIKARCGKCGKPLRRK